MNAEVGAYILSHMYDQLIQLISSTSRDVTCRSTSSGSAGSLVIYHWERRSMKLSGKSKFSTQFQRYHVLHPSYMLKTYLHSHCRLLLYWKTTGLSLQNIHRLFLNIFYFLLMSITITNYILLNYYVLTDVEQLYSFHYRDASSTFHKSIYKWDKPINVSLM